jgi:hypothetical protein
MLIVVNKYFFTACIYASEKIWLLGKNNHSVDALAGWAFNASARVKLFARVLQNYPYKVYSALIKI